MLKRSVDRIDSLGLPACVCDMALSFGVLPAVGKLILRSSTGSDGCWELMALLLLGKLHFLPSSSARFL